MVRPTQSFKETKGKAALSICKERRGDSWALDHSRGLKKRSLAKEESKGDIEREGGEEEEPDKEEEAYMHVPLAL